MSAPMATCPKCDRQLDSKGRHLDEEGDPMDYRETAIWCRPISPESAWEQTPQRKALIAGVSLKEWLRREAAGEHPAQQVSNALDPDGECKTYDLTTPLSEALQRPSR